MAGLSTGAPIVQVYHEKSRILPDVSRVLACLYEKGIKFETLTTSNKSLLKLQASKHTPVPFYDGPTFLEESREICHYIAEKYEHHGYPFLLGKDALERASVEQWLHNEEHAFNPPSRALFCHLAFPPDKDDNVDDIDMHKRKLEEVLEVYEQRLSDSEFLAGNMFTLADLVHLPNSHYITASEFVYLYDSRKNVRRWWDAISNRDSWQQVLRDMKSVEEQNRLEELKEQQQQKQHPRTSGYPRRISSREQMALRHQARPSTPIINAVPASGSHSVKRKIQEVTPDYGRTEDSGKPLVPSQEDQISHASQAIPRQEDMKYSPNASDSPSSDTQRPSEKAREHIVADDLGEAASKPPSDIREVRQPTVVPASAPAAQHGAATDEEALDKQKFVPSGQDSVHSTQPPSSSEQRNGRIGDSTPSKQQISSTKPKKGDVASTPDQAKDSEITLRGQDILPPVRSVSPSSDIQHPSGKVHDVPPNDLGEAKPIVQASAPDTQDETAQDEAAPDEKEFARPESTLSTEPRNEERRDSAPSTQLISSTEKMKENATIGAPDQGKDMQTTLDQQDILSETVRSSSPSSDTHRPSKKAREDAPADDLGEATSKPAVLVREVRPSTVVPRSAPTQYGVARDEALNKQKFVPSGQDSVHSALPRNGEIGDPAPSTQQISSTRPRKGDAAASTPEQAKDTQITPGRHNILPPVRLESPPSDTQHPSGKVHEDLPADNLREAEPILQASAPDTQDEKNIVPSEPTWSTEPRNKENGDSSPSAQLISSTGIRNEDAIIAAPDQDKDLQTTLDQQDILSAPVRSASPSSDTQHPSEKAREDAFADDLRVRTPTVVPASDPATLHGAAPNETDHDEQKVVASGQDSAQSVQPSFSTEKTKEDTIVSAADQTEDLQTIIHRQNITPSMDTTKTPLPGEEQVPLGRDEGHATEPYRTAVDEKKTTSPSSKVYSFESGSDLTQAHTDVHPSIGEGPTETSFPEHGLQTQPPLATHMSLGASNKAKSAGQEAKAPIASASETQPSSTQPQDEVAPIEQNFVVSDQETAHASKSPSTAEPRKGETYVFVPAQTNLPVAVLGNQDTRQTPDAREALSKSQESSRDDDGISNLVDPLVSQEQTSRIEHASEGPTSEVGSATIDEKATLPSSQAETSDIGPDSTLVTGDVHLTNAGMPATSSLQNQEAQPLAATQAATQAPPASSQNVHADSLENIETRRQPSKAPAAPVTSSSAYSDTPHSEPGTATIQIPQEASFDLSGGEKTTMTQGDQVNPLINGDLSTSQPVRPSESAGFKGINSKRKLEGALTYEKSKTQHQTDHSEIPSSKDNNDESNEAIRSDSWPKENIESGGESKHQEQADQAIVQSPDSNMKQIEQTKTHETETGEFEERDPQENTNQVNSKVSRLEAFDSLGKQTSGVQLRGENRKDASNSADDAPDDIQTRSNSEDNLTSYEESKVQQQSEGKTQGGETEAPLSDTVQQNGRGLPEKSYQNNSSQSQAEASDKSAEKLSPGIQNKNKSSSVLDGPTDGTKSGDAEDKSG